MDINELNEFVDQYRYYIILVLTVTAYKLGFALPLPLLKSTVIYLFLAAGCLLLTVLDIFGGGVIIGVLLLSNLVMLVFRLTRPRKKDGNEEG